jgi:hypothetical protein
MTGFGGGNPNPDAPPTGEYPERECPMCGATCKDLPAHLRHSCEVTEG